MALKAQDIIRRSQWGAAAPDHRSLIDLAGPSTVHWNGGGTKWANINTDAHLAWGMRRMRAVQGFHMNGKGWSDFAYSFAVDPWGDHVYEGRGLDVRPASQGTTEGNETSHSIYVMTGLGDGPVTTKCVGLINDLADYIAVEGTADPMVVGHRDWKSTTCPGDFLYGMLDQLNELDVNSNEPVAEAIHLQAPVAIFALEGGYAMVDVNGRVEGRGDADVYGDLRDVYGDLRWETLNAPIVDGEGTSAGHGYYLVGADGGVFAYGDAVYHGGLGDVVLNSPIVALEVEEGGYFLVAADGGVFAFGDLPFVGSFVGSVDE